MKPVADKTGGPGYGSAFTDEGIDNFGKQGGKLPALHRSTGVPTGGSAPPQPVISITAPPPDFAPLIPLGYALTPESMMALVEMRMGEMNKEAQGIIGEMDKARRLAKGLSDLKSKLGSLAESDDAKAQALQWAKELSPTIDDPKIKALVDGIALGIPNVDGDSANWVSEMQQRIDSITSDISSKGQTDMLRLQQIVSQQNQVLTFASNVSAAFNQREMGVINNLK